jgi:hypothetical protein
METIANAIAVVKKSFKGVWVTSFGLLVQLIGSRQLKPKRRGQFLQGFFPP